jgi:hypothetical protein
MRLLDSMDHVRLLMRLAALSSFALAGCSVLFSLDSTQCSADSDCELLGDAFEGTICRRSFCVTPEPAGTGGMGGGDGVCTSNSECIDAPENFGEPAVCREGSCFPLKIGTECPWVLGVGSDLDNLRQPDPIIIGAYAPIDLGAATKSPYVANYELAIDEMNETTSGGLSGGPGGSLRPFIAVICDTLPGADFDLSLGHLVDDLRVPAIISAIFAKDLKSAFTEKGLPNDVFFLSPLDADSSLTADGDGDLLWHMLGESHDLSPGFVSLVDDVETYVRQERGLADADSIKLALVDANTQFLNDITDDLLDDEGGLTFNGRDVFDNGDNFLRSQTDSSLEVAMPNVEEAVYDLQVFRPDVVVSVGSAEAVGLIRDFDATWNPAWGPKPFYVVSPYVFSQPGLLELADVHARMLGINFAAAEQTALYDKYYSNLTNAYDTEDLDGKENFYDVVYFLMYAIAAAGPPPITGTEIAAGMKRLIVSSSANRYEVGRTDINDALGTLAVPNTKIALVGTLGDPDFNLQTGARASLPSVYCIAGGMRIQNALLYDPVAGELYEPASGPQPCVPGFPP